MLPSTSSSNAAGEVGSGIGMESAFRFHHRRHQSSTSSSSSCHSPNSLLEIDSSSGGEGEVIAREKRSISSRDQDMILSKPSIGIQMDAVEKLAKGIEITKESNEALNRAVEYMQLYFSRYTHRHFSTDWVRRMLFYARIHGAPVSRIRFSDPKMNVRLERLLRSIAAGFSSRDWSDNIVNLEQFFSRMDFLETKYGERLWELHFIYGYEHFDRKTYETTYFRWQIISTIRSLYKACAERNWSEVAQQIGNISLTDASQKHSRGYFCTLRNSLAPYVPSIYLCALQCLLESKQPIERISQQFISTFAAFKPLSVSKHSWMCNTLLNFNHLLTFHLVNLHFYRDDSANVSDLLRIASNGVHLHDNAERRRIIILLEYCVDVEKQLLYQNEGLQFGDKKFQSQQDRLQNRSLVNFFPGFISALFEEPKSSIGLLPLAVWGAVQFDYVEELTNHIVDACTEYPFLLLHAFNVLARFRLEHIAGRLFDKFFVLAIDVLATSPILLDILEQRTLDPASFGSFDNAISQNLRGLFMFLDYGRNRVYARAWALFHSNLQYLCDNPELLKALVLPLWEKRKDWWPRIHSIRLSSEQAERMREQSFYILEKI